MTPLAELKTTALAATQGKRRYVKAHLMVTDDDRNAIARVVSVPIEQADADGKFIAACDRATILALVQIAETSAAYMLLRARREQACDSTAEFAQWCSDIRHVHANLLASLRDAGLLDQEGGR